MAKTLLKEFLPLIPARTAQFFLRVIISDLTSF